MVQRTCQYCQKPFFVPSYVVRRGEGRFCSIACRNAGRPHPIIFHVCDGCGRSFRVRRCETDRKFCSWACYRPLRNLTPAQRFLLIWEKIEKSADPSLCWVWPRARDKDGYGIMTISKQGETRTYKVHRLSYKIHKGEIPEGHGVLHRCDNSPCIRPSHLYSGTDQQNANDRQERGWIARGELNWRARLAVEQVKEIKKLLAQPNPPTQSILAQRFGVGQSAISSIWLEKTWKHVTV